tara:strand:+ start:1365 stop:1496 length:132 start_codon:yes stop_codon:yes gene_type:complete
VHAVENEGRIGMLRQHGFHQLPQACALVHPFSIVLAQREPNDR